MRDNRLYTPKSYKNLKKPGYTLELPDERSELKQLGFFFSDYTFPKSKLNSRNHIVALTSLLKNEQ